jgi:hypothetical protein
MHGYLRKISYIYEVSREGNHLNDSFPKEKSDIRRHQQPFRQQQPHLRKALFASRVCLLVRLHFVLMYRSLHGGRTPQYVNISILVFKDTLYISE